MSRQLCTRPAVWITDSMPEYASTQLATPTVITEMKCAMLVCSSACFTLSTLSAMMAGLRGSRWMKPSAIRFTNTKLAAMKIEKVTRAFSRMPMMLSTATPQMMPRISAYSVPADRGRKAVPLMTALTVEMHAVRM